MSSPYARRKHDAAILRREKLYNYYMPTGVKWTLDTHTHTHTRNARDSIELSWQRQAINTPTPESKLVNMRKLH